MSIWRNTRYRNFEHQAQAGDRFRGVPGQQFPWLLRTERAPDAQGDEWTFEVLCTGMESASVGLQMHANFTARARCNIKEQRLVDLGFETERLEWLGLELSNVIEEQIQVKAKLKMEAFDTYALVLLEKLKTQILGSTSNQAKRQSIKEAIAARPLSRFSENAWERRQNA